MTESLEVNSIYNLTQAAVQRRFCFFVMVDKSFLCEHFFVKKLLLEFSVQVRGGEGVGTACRV